MSQPLVQIVRGELADDELAALTAVLLTRATAPTAQTAGPVAAATPNWQRLERTSGYRAPHSWQR